MHINIAKINFKQIGINIAKVDFGLYGVVNYQDEYLTLSALGDGDITITIPEGINSSYATSISYSKDKSTWNETLIDNTKQTITIHVTSGENVYLKGIAKQLSNSTEGVINSTVNIVASGNIMSLLYGDDYKDKVTFQSGSSYTLAGLFKDNSHLINVDNLILPVMTLSEKCYYNMFSGCSSLTAAPKLPATTLGKSCYENMFLGCTSLTTTPELPATTLSVNCYKAMFQGCTSLTTAPELQAMTLSTNCYFYMFKECTSLTTAPELPATKIAAWCYYQMFTGCTSLTTAPELPATTLADNCYTSMFSGCTSLTTAPELPATTLVIGCYSYMLSNCRKLNHITMLATDISAESCLDNWVTGVSSTGTFIKAAEMTSLPTGNNGIPSGWTVVDYGAA